MKDEKHFWKARIVTRPSVYPNPLGEARLTQEQQGIKIQSRQWSPFFPCPWAFSDLAQHRHCKCSKCFSPQLGMYDSYSTGPQFWLNTGITQGALKTLKVQFQIKSEFLEMEPSSSYFKISRWLQCATRTEKLLSLYITIIQELSFIFGIHRHHLENCWSQKPHASSQFLISVGVGRIPTCVLLF